MEKNAHELHRIEVNEKTYSEIEQGIRRCLLVREDAVYKPGDALLLRVEVDDNRVCGKAMALDIRHVQYSVPDNGIVPGFCLLSISTPEDGEKLLAMEIAEALKVALRKLMLYKP